MDSSDSASHFSGELGGGETALLVRGFRDSDRQTVLKLYPRGLVNPDSGETLSIITDAIDDISGQNARIWVAEVDGQLIACLIVVGAGPEVAHLRGLSIVPEVEQRNLVIRRLVDTAVTAAWDDGFLKLVVHTSRSGAELEPYFHRVSFEFSRETWVDGTHVLEFYQNIYQRPQSQREETTKQKRRRSWAVERRGLRIDQASAPVTSIEIENT